MHQNAFLNKTFLSVIAIISVAAIFGTYSPLGSITATPKFWRDEAIPFELARTFLELGKLDMVVAPNETDGRPYLTHATGFTATVPLAGFFKVFGIGVLQARIFMLIWIGAALIVLFFVLKKFFGLRHALVGTVFVASFGPFYANGRTFTGEIPGLFFLFIGLYYLYHKKAYTVAGSFIALAAVTKPSVFLLIFPALAVEFLIFERKNLIRNGTRFSLGVLPVMLLWIWVILPQPLLLESWQGMIELYRNPFNAQSLFSRPAEIMGLFTHSTILYFGLITFLHVIALFKISAYENNRRLVSFIFLYGIMSAVYFLRSPGWFRYLLGYEVLVLAILPVALGFLVRSRKKLFYLLVVGVFVLHTVNYFMFPDIPSGTASIETASFLNDEVLAAVPDATIGFIYMPTVAPLVEPHRKYQIGTIGGNEVYGVHPLTLDEDILPTFIIGFDGEYEDILNDNYSFFSSTPLQKDLYKKNTK
jgi:hypothetical protein